MLVELSFLSFNPFHQSLQVNPILCLIKRLIKGILALFVLIIGLTFPMQTWSQNTAPRVNDSLKVVFSQKGGFYSANFSLKLSTPDPAYSIWYTIDGSNPQTSSTAVKGGSSKTITVNPSLSSGRPLTPCFIVRASLARDGYSPSLPVTQTYIFLDKVIDQGKPGGGWPSSNVNGQMIDLVMDPDITKSSKYSPLMKESLTDIPSISVVTDLANLFNSNTGIYVNAMEDGADWERFCSVELLNPDGSEGFNLDAGLRIRGGWSRHDNYPKHGFRLFFREEYGASKLKFPLFGDEGVKEFDKIDLRCEQNYSWSNDASVSSHNTCVREVFSRDTQRDMGQPYTRSRYYHLYLNGMYWGLFQTQERSEASFASSYFGGSKDDYDVIKVMDGSVNATDGTTDLWKKVYNLCNKGFTTNDAYFSLEGKDAQGNPRKGGEVLVNIDNLIDYMLTIFYTGNFDAPTSAFGDNSGVNNFYTLNRRDDKSEGFIFFNHDGEHAMMIDPVSPGIGLYEDRVNLKMSVSGFSVFHPQWLHYKLSFNKEYCQRFADRVYKHFFNKGVFVPEIAEARFQKRVDQIDKAIIAESARWGDAQTPVAYTRDDWQAEIDDIYERFFPYRTDIVLDQLIQAGLYSNYSPPEIKKDGVLLDADVYTNSGKATLSLSCPLGAIYYTTDGSDPRLIGGQTNPSVSKLGSEGKIEIDGTTWLKVRVKAGENWSALREIKFLNSTEDYSNLKVTELHYHPKDSIIGTDTISGKSFEFFELKNIGEKPVNLSGLKFASSVKYNFPENTLLAPKQFFVIASKPKWFYERHSMIPSGNFENNFSNSGEIITIANQIGNEVISFTYFDKNPWAEEADGEGNSLSATLRYPTGNPNDPTYWKASTLYDGSPFADDRGILDYKEDISLTATKVALFPNPTYGPVTVRIDGKADNAQLEIYNLQGIKLCESVLSGTQTINLNQLPVNPGMLIVKIKIGGHTFVNKVIYKDVE